MSWKLFLNNRPDAPARWDRDAGLVKLVVQDHPHEVVRNMRWTWTVYVAGVERRKAHAWNERQAKNRATQYARALLADALNQLSRRPRKRVQVVT